MNQSDIQLRLYRVILLVGATLSVLCIIGNYFSAFPFLLDLKWIALFFITIIAFIFSKNEKYTPHIMLGVFVFLIFIFLPFAFIDSGGSSNNAMGYTFLLMIVITYLFSGRKRIFLICALIITFMIMHAVEYYYPELISVYSAQAQFVDRMIQIPLILFASFKIILRFTKEYERVNQELNVMAKFDELTGLYNRRMFNKEIDKAFNTNDKPIYLAYLDLNNFKKVNDKCGHSVGDKALIELSRILQKVFGFDKHIVSRWGGDEFAIIYYGKKDDFINKLDHIDKEFKTYVSTYEDSAGISISVVSFSDYETISDMFNSVDMQLYKKKHDFKKMKF